MRPITECPDEKLLESALLGLLPEHDSEIVERHLAECPGCLVRTRNIAVADTFVDLFKRQPASAADAPLPAFAGELLERMKSLQSSHEATHISAADGTHPGNSANEPSVVEFLDQFSPAETPDELGRLAGFRILKLLGKGGMGAVFLAEDVQLRRHVALKIMHSAFATRQDAAERFLREARAAAAIKHVHVVTIYQVGQERGIPFLAQELLTGEMLDDALRRQPLALAETLRIGREIALGLAAAHRRGLLHRDIKPSNIWLEDDLRRVKILDFGLARSSEADAELTGTGMILGTPAYMAPEQAQGDRVDERCDLFSLGCVLYRMTTGRLPFQGNNALSVLRSLAIDTPAAPRSLNPDVTQAVSDFIDKMLSKDREQRPASAESVAETLLALSHSASVATGPAESAPATDGFPAHALGHRPRGRGSVKMLLAISGGVLGAVLLLAGLVISFKTKDGTLTVTVNEPDAEVQVLDGEGQVEITRKGEKGPITITVDPGKHRLKVRKDRFEFFTEEFEIESGGKKSITAKLVPEGDKPAVVATKPAPVVGVKPPAIAGIPKPLAFETPGFTQWMKEVAGMPAEKQVQAVVKKLQNLNPEFDGKVRGTYGQGSPTIENGVVKILEFYTDNVTDISPVRALAGLRHLYLAGNSLEKSKLTDLSPLRGMALTGLDIHGTQVADLSPLQGMKISYLNCAGANVTDLSPLSGMPLTHLQVEHTQVSDLSGLRGMPLEELNLGGLLVTDLLPIRGMPLKELNLVSTHVADLSPLENAPLQRLVLDFKPNRDTALLRSIKTLETINGKPAADFCDAVEAYQAAAKQPRAFQTPGFDQWVKEVAAMPAEEQVKAVAKKLQELNPGFDGNEKHTIEIGVVTHLAFLADNVTDISPVRALPGLKSLSCLDSGGDQQHLGDLSPLEGMSLIGLVVNNTQIADLAQPLKGMKLLWLHCVRTNVTDLSPLQDMPLNALKIDDCPVSNLFPLKDLQLVSLHCTHTLVSDLSVLTGMPLKEFSCDFKPARDTALLRSIKTLETINYKPAAEFWKAVEGQSPGKKPLAFETPGFAQWVKEVAALPAEKQVAAVVKKLRELNPGFDGKVLGPNREGAPTIEKGVVTGLGLVTDDVIDLSPVRAFGGLVNLTCNGVVQSTGKLADLSPLKNVPLQRLNVQYNQVSDLSPLEGMKLRRLNCGSTKVVDLAPLENMPLTYLELIQTRVSDLAPLKGMRLEHLDVQETQVDNLSPVEGMPLQDLNIALTEVSDLSVLKGMPLKILRVFQTPVSDLLPLKGMQLTTFMCKYTRVSDLSVLRGMPLAVLICDQSQVEDLSPLEGMPLEFMQFTPWDITRGLDVLRSMKSLKTMGISWADLWPVEEFWKKYDAGEFGKTTTVAKPITTLNEPAFQQWLKDVAAMPAEEQVQAVTRKLDDLNPGFKGTVTHKSENGVVIDFLLHTDNVTDISPVRALTGLKALVCQGTSPRQGQLSDLSPLSGMKLSYLGCENNQVSDLMPLKGMPLTDLNCGGSKVSDLAPLQGMPLRDLACSVTKVSDLTPLTGMPLSVLACECTNVSNLTPLHGMRLRGISIWESPVTDLSPLQGMPLSQLNIQRTHVADLSPIQGIPLKHLVLSFKPERDAELLRSIKTLETINYEPAAEFWKAVEERRKRQKR